MSGAENLLTAPNSVENSSLERQQQRALNPSEAANHGAQQEVWNILIRSSKLPNGQVSVPTMPSSDLITLVEFINEVVGEAGTSVDPKYARLIIKGKSLDLQSRVDSVLKNGDTAMLVFSSAKEIEAMRKAEKVDNRIRSFEEEEELHRRRLEISSAGYNSYWGEDQDPKYRFVKIETCPRFTTPHPFEAEWLLIKLATDPGIKKIMKKYQWTVGTLAEMDPKSDMISLRKEQDGVCVLGYNENMGHKIYLRLRTDDELEFRGYDALINTLLHELTHNVRGPHDEEFWRVFGQLKTEYLQFHETEYSQGGAKARRVVNAKGKVERELRSQAGNRALSESERQAARSIVAQPKAEAPKPYIPMRLGATHSQARKEERERLAAAAEARFGQQEEQRKQQEEHLKQSKVSTPISPEPSKCDCGGDHSEPDHGVKEMEIVHQEARQVKEQTPMTATMFTNEPAKSVGQKDEVPQQMKMEVEQPKFNEPSPVGLDEEHTSDRERRVRASIIQLCRSGNTSGAALAATIIHNAMTGNAKYRQVKTTGERFRQSVDQPCSALLEAVGFEQSEDGMMYLRRDDPGLLILAKLLLNDSGLVQSA